MVDGDAARRRMVSHVFCRHSAACSWQVPLSRFTLHQHTKLFQAGMQQPEAISATEQRIPAPRHMLYSSAHKVGGIRHHHSKGMMQVCWHVIWIIEVIEAVVAQDLHIWQKTILGKHSSGAKLAGQNKGLPQIFCRTQKQWLQRQGAAPAGP